MKQYLTESEAADLACVPVERFAEVAPKQGIVPVAWMGTIVYRRADIETAMDRAWQASIENQAGYGTYRGTRGNGLSGVVSVELPKPKPRRSGLPRP